MLVYPLDEAHAILANLVAFMATAEDALGARAAFTATPDGEPLLALVGVYNGPVGDGEAALAPLRGFRKPLRDTFAPTPYRTLQTLFDTGAPAGLRYYWKSSFLDHLPADALDSVIGQARNRPSPASKIFLEFLGGAFSRVPREAAVFDHRRSRYNLLIIGAWDQVDADAANRRWTRDTWNAMQPFASEGVYVNDLGTEADEGGNRLAAAYGPGKLEKLVPLKHKYDPENLFRMNQNIRPAA